MNVLQFERPDVKGDPDLIPKKDAVVEEDSCPGWNLVVEERLKIPTASRTALLIVGNRSLPSPRSAFLTVRMPVLAAIGQSAREQQRSISPKLPVMTSLPP